MNASSALSGREEVLATGGSLASGRVGLFDAYDDGVALTRRYDDFSASAPATDAVLYASQSAELATSGMVREDSTGTAFGPVSIVNGDLPRMPNQSSGGTVEVFVKASRGDLEALPDPAMDDISVRVYRRKCWLTTPGS